MKKKFKNTLGHTELTRSQIAAKLVDNVQGKTGRHVHLRNNMIVSTFK